MNLEYLGCIYKVLDYENFAGQNIISLDQISRVIIKDSKTKRVIIDPFAQYSVSYSKTDYQFQLYYQLQPVVFKHEDLELKYSDHVQVTTQKLLDIIENDIYLRIDITKYQKQYKLKNINTIVTLSNVALGFVQRTQGMYCQQTDPKSTEYLNLMKTYTSDTKFNISELRSIASPSHVKMQQDCPDMLGQKCLDSNSQYINYQKILRQSFEISDFEFLCFLNKSDSFTFHSYYDQLLQNISKLKNIGNISNFVNEFIIFEKLISQNQFEDAIQLPLINFVLMNNNAVSKFQEVMDYRYFIQKVEGDQLVNIMLDEIVPDDTIVVISFIVLDLFIQLQKISLFTALTNHLVNLTNNPDIDQIQIGSIDINTQDDQYSILFENYYQQYLSEIDISSQPLSIQQNIQDRIKMYLYGYKAYQLHYYTYSSGDNWLPIMKEQLKAQPLGFTGKFRIGYINGKLSITKAINIQSKNLDNRTSTGGFLTIVLKSSINFPLNDNFTVFDSSLRFIHGINDKQYEKGIKYILYKYNYIQQTKINYTTNNVQSVLELNYSFWNDALQKAKANQFTLVITQNILSNNNRISEADYNQSEIHQRTVIFDAKCDYFESGKIYVKQLGALDAVLIIYQDVILSNYTLEQSINNSFTPETISYFYNDLNSRELATTYYAYNIFPDTFIDPTTSYQFPISEIPVIMFIFCVPLILNIVFLVIRKLFRKQQSYELFENFEQISYVDSSTCVKYKKRFIINHLNYKQRTITELAENYTLNEEYMFQNQQYLIFDSDQKQQFSLSSLVIYEQLFPFLKLQSNQTENFQFSFSILVPSQQYSQMINSVILRKTYLSNHFLQINCKQVMYKTIITKIMPVKSSNASKRVSRLNSVVNSQNQSESNFISMSYDMNEFYYRNTFSPLRVQIYTFKTYQIEESTDFLLELSFE
ncbi:Conserved_hypothetical protein [Hexamita inflata]|uniref:Transmembrane protein n=1 Tax=Hexamita inflata TaxID=28002 RepID=A0AA86PJY6_9EUKA|nr:Conserved hypothetical protein [Hexamita inflata]